MNDEKIEAVMEAVCSLCQWPYAEEDQEALDEQCVRCPVERMLKEDK